MKKILLRSHNWISDASFMLHSSANLLSFADPAIELRALHFQDLKYYN